MLAAPGVAFSVADTYARRQPRGVKFTVSILETRANVSGMATEGAGSDLTPEEARDALRMADAEELATVNRPVPGWYFPLLSVMILAVFILNAVIDQYPGASWIILVLAIGIPIVIAFLVGRFTLSQPGYRGVRMTRRPRTIAAILIAAALAIAPLILAGTVGTWIWAVCGIILSGLIVGFGIAYWRRYPRG
jgi:hypothetical protein